MSDKPNLIKKCELWRFCEDFIEKHKLHKDNAYDIDKWSNHSTTLIYGILDIVGEYEYKEDEDEQP
jgi:hypothetical protein